MEGRIAVKRTAGMKRTGITEIANRRKEGGRGKDSKEKDRNAFLSAASFLLSSLKLSSYL